MTNTTFNISELAEEALEAFWKPVTCRFPEITTGDLPFDMAIRLKLVAKQSIEAWMFYNVPDNSGSDESDE